MKNPLLKGSCTDSLDPKASNKTPDWKAQWSWWRGSTYWSWSVCWRGRKPLGWSLRTEMLAGILLMGSYCFANTGSGGCHFGNHSRICEYQSLCLTKSTTHYCTSAGPRSQLNHNSAHRCLAASWPGHSRHMQLT